MEEIIDKKNDLSGEKNRVFLKGLVVPSLWNDSGSVTGISLSTFNEEIYLIENNKKGRDLIGYLGKEVEVEGVLASEGLSKKIIVNDFHYFDFS